MKLSNTTLRELSAKYKSVLKKCAYLNAIAIIGMASIANAANISWDGISDKEMNEGDVWRSSQTMTATGTLTGLGTVQATPEYQTSTYKDSTLTFASDISGFNGDFTTIQYGVASAPNAVSSILFQKWADGHNFNLSGNGNFFFDGSANEQKNDVKITLTSSGNGGTAVYLNDNTLAKDSSITKNIAVFSGNKGTDDTGRNITLDGYDLDKVSLYVSGANNKTTGDLVANVKNSHFYSILGVGNNTDVTGDVTLNLEDSVFDYTVVGQTATGGTYTPVDTMIEGDINIYGKNIYAKEILGQTFAVAGEIASGIKGDINIVLEDSTVNQVRGINYTAGDYQNWNANYFVAPKNVNISVKDSVIKEELLATGAYPSAGNVKIDVLGDTVIGYTDATAQTLSGADGWIIAGAQRPGARIESTEVNLNTLTEDNAIKIAGDVQIGSRQKSDPNNSDADSVTGDATLNILGGGTVDIGGDVRAYHVKGTTTLNIADTTATVAGTIKDEFDTISLTNSTLNTQNLVIKDGAVINMTLGTSVINVGNIASFDGAATYNLILKNDQSDETVDLISTQYISATYGQVNITDNPLYNFQWTEYGAQVRVSVKNGEELIENLPAETTAEEANTISAIANTAGNGTVAGNTIAERISVAMQTDNGSAAVKAAKDLAPTNSQTVMGVAQNVNTVLSTVAGKRMASVGRAGGDAFVGGALWVEGLYNHSEQDSTSKTDGFTADTKGISFGIDGKVSDAWMVGFGYGYTDTDADAGDHDVDVEGHNFFVYTEYKPNNWYVNGMFSYGLNKYEENKAPMGVALKAKYDVDTYAANVMTGYDFENGLNPEIGLRYLLADQESYNDGAQRIDSENTDVLTGVVAIKHHQTYKAAKDLTLKHNLRLAATYDMMSDDSKANVSVIGGSAYQINGERLERFGVEAGIGIEAIVKDWNFSVDYNGGFRKDYQSHTGMLKAKYNF